MALIGLIPFIIIGCIALLFAAIKAYLILSKSPGDKKMQEIAAAIHDIAMAFLKRENKILCIIVAVVAVLLLLFINWQTAVAFVVGSLCSSLAGYFGMQIATRASSRITEATKNSLGDAFRIAFSSGTVTAMCVAGLGLLGATFLIMLLKDPFLLFGFCFGASSVALLVRVGGCIFAKAAGISAELAGKTGKVEKSIRDNSRNLMMIADKAGTSVAGVAGISADLFESYAISLIAAMALGAIQYGQSGIQLPLALAAVGILASILGTFFVRAKTEKKLSAAFRNGVIITLILIIVGSYYSIGYYVRDIGVFYAMMIGLVAGAAISLFTEWYTSPAYRPTQKVAAAATTGTAAAITQGLAAGMESVVFPLLTLAVVVYLSYFFAGLYGIAMASLGMLSTLGISLAIGAYGPVASNAGSIAQLAKQDSFVRERTSALGAVVATISAMGKGVAISTAALAALALFSIFAIASKLDAISLTDPGVVIGLLIGGFLSFLFCARAMNAAQETAFGMMASAHRQLKSIKSVMKGKEEVDYFMFVGASTTTVLKRMVFPGLLAVLSPVIVGFMFGLEALGGMLAGSLVTGAVLAIMMTNSSGTLVNAKKFLELRKLGTKVSDAHKAAVVGDTVGDSLKDTTGPSITTLIKLMAILSIIIAPLVLKFVN